MERAIVSFFVLFATACGSPTKPITPTQSGITGERDTDASTEDGGDGDSGGGAGAPGGEGDGDPGGDGDGDSDPSPGNHPKFDLGVVPDAGFLVGCRAVDFLFVIDNSGSMQQQQQQLLTSFPGFITAIEGTLENVDSIHVGVITSDVYSHNDPSCRQLGALVTQTIQGSCGPFAEGSRFLTEADDLAAGFSCIANVGAVGSGVELPISATVAAVSPQMNAANACNEGFLRDDAILVVVVITDDPPTSTVDDANLSSDPTPWYDAIVAAKDGDPEAIVMIGFVPWQNVMCAWDESPVLISFIELFGLQGVLASVCEPDYGPIFDMSIETIEETCLQFTG